MKQIITIIIAIFVISVVAYSIDPPYYKYTYSYDGAGNRTGRTCEYFKGKIITQQKTENTKKVTIEHDITISPNPTTGMVAVTITNLAKNDAGSIEIYDMKGTKVYNSPSISGQANIDIRKEVSGTYFVKIRINDKETTIKIMKVK